ncbi:MAG TPA: hypothetical protein VLQ93_00260 [Myxococcaceae bacterium]|nr:hypothetical protein [Myxococcaceae bacterium]
MAETLQATAEALSASRSSLRRLAGLVGHLGQELELEDFRTGHWFNRLVSLYLRHYDAHGLRRAIEAQGSGAESTEAIIHRACLEATLSGTGSAAVTTGASVYAAQSGGLAWLLALPISGLTLGGEMLLRALLHLRMACDLASAFGLSFQPDDPSDLCDLHCLAFGIGPWKVPEAPDKDFLHQLVGSEAEEMGQAIGSRLLGESLARNALPFVSLLTSSITSWRRTRQLGDTVLRYVRRRRALEDALDSLRRHDSEAVELLLEGAWFLFISDDWLDPEEATVLTWLLRAASTDSQRRLMERFEPQDSGWLERLRSVPPRTREPLMKALRVLSASSAESSPREQRVLARAARALGIRYEPSQSSSPSRNMEPFAPPPAGPAEV